MGSTRYGLVFIREAEAGHTVLAGLPWPLGLNAVVLPGDSDTPATVELLLVPTTNPEDPQLVAGARDWATRGPTPAQLMTFQGVMLVWAQDRLALLGPPERLEVLKPLAAELSYYEHELRELEKALGAWWPELEADSGPAFEINDKTAGQKKRLAQRFRDLLHLRARLTRILPMILTPHVYPPTLASQISERFRERTRLAHRLEVLQEQLEVYERVYDTCSQRVSDYTANRKSNILEMIIIVLLIAQVVLSLFEILSTTRS
jgi:hypothetical protein